MHDCLAVAMAEIAYNWNPTGTRKDIGELRHMPLSLTVCQRDQ